MHLAFNHGFRSGTGVGGADIAPPAMSADSIADMRHIGMSVPPRSSALQTSIFMKVPHDLFKLTTGDENAGGPRFVGAGVATERDPPPILYFNKSTV